MYLLKFRRAFLFFKLTLCFIVFLIPESCFGYQGNKVIDSIKLEKTINTLKSIDPNNVDSIVLVTDEALSVYRSKRNLRALHRVNQATAFVLAKYGYLGLSEKYNLDAIDLSKELKDLPNEVDNTNMIGVLWAKRGDFVKGESFFLSALLLAEKGNYTEGSVSSYLKLGTLRTRQGRFDESMKFYNKLDSVNTANNTRFNENDVMANKAILYAIKGDLVEAERLFRKANAWAIKDGKVTEQVLSLQNLGLIYKEKSDYKKAKEILEEGLALAKKHGLAETGLRLEVNLPLLLVEQEKYKLAETQYLNIADRAKKAGIDDLVVEVFQNLVQLSEMEGNYKSAYKYLQELNRFKNLQFNEQKERSLAEANVSLGLYRANAKLLENENLLFQKDRERSIVIGILAFVGLLLFVLTLILFRLKKFNDKLNRKKEELTESNNIKNKLFSIIGHDLRGNQGTTLGILELLKDDEFDGAEKKKYLDLIIKQSKSALATLDDLLLWGQAQIKGGAQQKSSFDIVPLINRSLDLNTEAVHEKELKIKIIDIEGKYAFADTNHFSFIIRNLLANAIKFTQKGGTIRIYAMDYKKGLLKICVADNGIGVAKEELLTIFSPESISKSGTNNETGTGLGLTLCKEFVEANGGEIWAERNIEGGTTVCFTSLKA